MSINITHTIERIHTARAKLYMKESFFAGIGVHLAWLVDDTIFDSNNNPTMCTNGKSVKINPLCLGNWSMANIVFVIAHEILHNGLNHMVRIKLFFNFVAELTGEHWMIWNIATDYVINAMLRRDNIGTMPEGALYEAKYEGWSEEAIANDLIKFKRDDPEGFKKKHGTPDEPAHTSCGEVEQAPAPTPGADGKIEEQADFVEISKMAAKMANKVFEKSEAGRERACKAMGKNFEPGKLPGYLKDFISNKVSAKPSAYSMMADFIDSKVATSYDYTRRNRRTIGNVINPRRSSDGLERVAIITDTSGSMLDHHLAFFGGVIDEFLKSGKVLEIDAIFIDRSIQHRQTFKANDTFVMKRYGGGGTDLSKAFDAVAADPDGYTAVMCFSDMENYRWGAEPDCPVLFVDYAPTPKGSSGYKSVPPFGTIVEHH